MPSPKTRTFESGADAGSPGADDGRSRAGTQRSGATDGITVTRWSLGLSLTIALTVVTGAFTLVWNQTVRLGETQVQLIATVADLGGRMTGLEARMSGLESEVREEIGGLREEIRELADLIRERELPGSPAQ